MNSIINNKWKGVLIFGVLITLFYINILNVRAGIFDDETIVESTQSDNVIEVSEFDENGNKGYIEVEYSINANNSVDNKRVILKYYKYARVIENGKEVPLYLYNWTNTTFDEEIQKEVAKSNNNTLTDFYDPSGLSKYAINDISYSFSSLFMWPISSSGDTYVKGMDNIKKAVKKHDINNFTEISKEKNFNLVYLLNLNTYAYGRNYVTAGYTYPIKMINTDTERLKVIKNIEDIVGRKNTYSKVYKKYFTSEGVNGYNGNLNNVSQTFFEHTNYFKFYSKDKAIKFSADMKTQNGFNYMFLSKDKNALYPRIVWNADSNGLGYGREVANYTRGSNVLGDSSFKNVSFQNAWDENSRSINEKWAETSGLSPDMGVVNQLVASEIGGNLSSKYYKNYENVNEKAVSTFWSFSRTYSTFYSKMASKVANNPKWKEINEDDDIKFPTSVSAFNSLIKKDFNTAYRYSQQMTIEMCRTFMISGYSCKETTGTLYVRTTTNSYRSFDSVKLSYNVDEYSASITRGDIAITNTPNSQSVMNNLVVIDLRKALGITDRDYNSFINILDTLRGTNKDYNNVDLNNLITKLESEKITTFTTHSGKRAVTLLLAGFQNKDVGIYLTNPEMEKGQVKYNPKTKSLDYLDSETVYVLATTLQYSTNHSKSSIPNILEGNYDISDYKDIYLEGRRNLTKKEERLKEKLLKITTKMAFPLFKEQIHMYTNNPRVQMMMIVSSSDKYAGKEAITWTSGRRYLNLINPSLYEEKFNSQTAKKSLAKNYYYELFDFTDKPLINTNTIRFNTKAGDRLKGITYTNENSGRYFELVDVDFTTSDIRAENKLIDKTNGSAKVIIKHDSASALGSFVKRNNRYDLKDKEVYGYWNLGNGYSSGNLDFADCLTYFATFYVPKYASRISSDNVYSRTIDGKLNNASLTSYSQTGEKKVVKANKLASETKGIKFISKIVANEKGFFEDYSKVENINELKDLIAFLKKNNLNQLSINQVNVKITGNSDIYLDEEGTIIIEVPDERTRNSIGTASLNYLKNCLEGNDQFKLTKINNLDLNQAYKTLGVNGTVAILISLYIQDSNKFNDVAFISTGVNIPPEDILISNSLNKDTLNNSTNTRNSIDWDSSLNNYNIEASLKLNSDKSLGKNILDSDNIVEEDEAKKIRAKNTTLSTPTESTKIYGDVFIGRIPEAKKAGIYVGDYTLLMSEKFNETKFSASSNSANNTRIAYIYNSLKEGTTQATLSKYLDEMNTYYYKGILYNLALGKETLTNIKVYPIQYKEVSNPNNIQKDNSKLKMSDWIEIEDSNKLAFTPGMIVKYRWEYNLPYGNQSTTIKYMNTQAGRLYKSSLSKLTALTSLELDFTLIPTIKEDGTVKNEKSLIVDSNLRNNFTKLYANLTDGGNLTFVEVVVKTSKTNVELYNKKYTYEEAVKMKNLLNIYLSTDDISKDNNGYFTEDLKVSTSVIYKNLSDETKVSKNKSFPLQVTNYYYNTPKSGTINSSLTGPYKDNTIIKYNESFTDNNLLLIPTSKGIKDTEYLEIKCPLSSPRDYVDNSIEDFETIRIYVQSKPEEKKDNAVTDIILYREDKTILGDNNEGNTTNLLNQNIIKNNESTKSVYARVKVKRLAGNMEEDKYNLFLTLSYIADGQRINRNITLDENNGTLSSKGDEIYFETELITASKSISSLTIKADYRNKESIDFDSNDININNNTRTESWVANYDISVNINDLPSYTINLKDGQDPYTTPINPKVSPSITANINITLNDGMYLGEQISSEVNIYLLNIANNKKYYPESVSGLTDYKKSNGTGKLAITGSAQNILAMNFKDLSLIAGECQVYVSVKPDKYQLLETIPWNADPTQTNNIDIKSFNVSTTKVTTKITEPCQDSEKTPSAIYWNTKFTWSNRVKSKPVQTDKWYSYTDDKGRVHRYFVCCSCNSQSGKNDGQSNWGPNGDRYNHYGLEQGPYYEKIEIIPYVWTSSKGWEITNNKEVFTGESIRVRLKVEHKSNRDILPLAPYTDEMGRNKPYSINGIGHVWGCDYLSRWPNISRIEGPQKMWYQISGTRGFDKTVVENYDSTEINGMVNRTHLWDILPQVSIPVTNKKQEIYIKYSLVPYWGYNFSTDPLHTKKQLCTRGNLKITISPSTTIPGDDEYEGIGTGVE